MIDESYAAWAELRTVLPKGWVLYPPELDTAHRRWLIRAQYVADPARARPWREASGETETTALQALAEQFRADGRLVMTGAS
jgi:hypothetical protein